MTCPGGPTACRAGLAETGVESSGTATDRERPRYNVCVPWVIVDKRIGRAGGAKQREARQRQWDREYGEDNWAIGYVIDEQFVMQEQALVDVYHRSYDAHFAAHP